MVDSVSDTVKTVTGSKKSTFTALTCTLICTILMLNYFHFLCPPNPLLNLFDYFKH